MKFTLSVVALFAFVAFVQATPVPEDEPAAPNRPLINFFTSAMNTAQGAYNSAYNTAASAARATADVVNNFVGNTAQTVGNGLNSGAETFTNGVNGAVNFALPMPAAAAPAEA